MGWLGDSKYNCPECDGEKSVECFECGQERDCEHCEGTGWNPGQVDVTAFRAAEAALDQKMQDAGCVCLTCEWIDRETNTRLGRDGGKYGTVAVADFL